MVNIGDTVLVNVHTWIPSIVAGDFSLPSNLKSALQARLQQAGFRVLRIDDSDLSWLSNVYGNMLVTVIPQTSAYADPNDVASVVAGAAAAVGYGYDTATGQVVALAARPQAPLTTPGYQAGLQQPIQISGGASDLSSMLGITPTTLLIGAAAAIALLVLSRR